MDAGAVWVILAQSFNDSIRGKWFLLFSSIYFLLVIGLPVIALAAFSLLPPGYLKTYLATFIAVAYTYIPLITLPVGATVLVAERESGTLQYVMSNPISKADFLLGRMFGLLLATSMVVVIGFGIAAALVYGYEFGQYATLGLALVAALMLNAIMLALSLVVSIVSNSRSTAVGVAIFFWFLFSVIYDIGTLGVLSSSSSRADPYVALPGLILDPVYTSRSWAVITLGKSITQNQAISLISTTAIFGGETGLVLVGIMIAWLAICIGTAFRLFSRRDVV